ncbi:SGNH/GDSL hydrolase family protein [Mucilaginibacter gilvus]|uniref:Twin-arginine translocation signal domain-containing protein n=1 Tax=Mucilaginibacter gilvus TaxID=2305909 RepID=A0A3S3UXT3_9SPHI|nr:SGNH/GDSL hydrolase family protein [Mucilaginibacter gilvus]RWY57186.1 twin-arginine translocation signal domain-containing protein [Mucilaginibacter gilvus]
MKNFLLNSRRNFIKNAAIGTVATLSIPQIVSAAVGTSSAKKVELNDNDIILFQGDSITDWGRDKSKTEANNPSSLGNGYVIHTTGALLVKYPHKNLKIFNKGISGNKVYQLAERWDTDCIALKPTVLSIHIGVNDFWHTLTSGYKGTIENYIADYKKLIESTHKALPGIKIIICEPFAVKGVRAVDDKWYPAFDAYRQAARDIATQYGLPFVPYQSVYDKALETAPGSYWTTDGVHPSIAGAKLMAEAWVQVVKG